MEALRIVKKPENGHLRLDIILPDDAGQGEFEVIVRPLYPQKQSELPEEKPERYLIAQQFKGSLKGTSYNTDKYDVYDQ